ncbi:MAG: hypothetical protein MJ107_08805 [Lachnospiraceae bacterium]|nr:hypothetical protein [Lachnospiraceae bacterium]
MENRYDNYNYENTARKEIKVDELQPTYRPLKELKGEEQRKRRMNMSPLFMMFLVGAFAILVSVVIMNIRVTSEMNATVDKVGVLEAQLNKLTLENEDEYSKMVNAVDLEEIKRIAVEELGMVYPDDSQYIYYHRENSDYVRQLKDIPN